MRTKVHVFPKEMLPLASGYWSKSNFHVLFLALLAMFMIFIDSYLRVLHAQLEPNIGDLLMGISCFLTLFKETKLVI